jgi:hypothetical protein
MKKQGVNEVLSPLILLARACDKIQVDDIGTNVSMAVFTNNAQNIAEVNAESATTQQRDG